MMFPVNKRINPVVKTAGALPVYSTKTPVKPRLGLGRVLRRVPVEGLTGKFNIKPIRSAASLFYPQGLKNKFNVSRSTLPWLR